MAEHIEAKTMEMMEYGLTSFVRADRVGGLGSFSTELAAMRLKQEANVMRMKLTTDVLADKLPPVEIDRKTKAFFWFPESPFQHWKSKHAHTSWLGWFVRRWPVRHAEHVREVRLIVNLQRFRTYPEASIQVPPNDELLGRARFGYSLDERIERT